MAGSIETLAGSAVVCSILEANPAQTAAALERVPAGCALAEIRGDRLTGAELASLVAGAARPVIATVRRPADGGSFPGSEEERRGILLGALDAGARFVDVEWNSPLRDLAEGEAADRVILSHHGAACRLESLRPIYEAMGSSRAARLKLVPLAATAPETGAVREMLSLAREQGRALACFAMGPAGSISRLLAPSWGSWATFGAGRREASTAPGQLTAHEMIETYDVLGIGPATRRFALIGNAVSTSPSPALHRAGYLEAGIDARYFALEIDELEGCFPLLGEGSVAGIEALGVTLPFKEAAAARSRLDDPIARGSGAVNTVRIGDEGWVGYNTDGPAMLDLVGRHLKPRGARIAIVGAGGTARAAATVFHASGAHVCLFNRTLSRVETVAAALGVEALPLDRLAGTSWDALIQATPLGTHGEALLSRDELRGSVVLDAVYGAETPLIREARRRGLVAMDGLELLVAQAVLQFELMTGRRPDPATLERAGRAWLAVRASGADPA